MLKLIVLILLSSLLSSAIALSSGKSINSNVKRSCRSSSSPSSTALYLKKDGDLEDSNSNDSNKQKRKIISTKVIRPEDLDNLFSIADNDDDNEIDDSSYSNDNDNIDNNDDNNNDDINNNIDDTIDDNRMPSITSSTSSTSSSSTSSSSSKPSRYDVSGRETDEASSSMIELGNLERMMRLPISSSNIDSERAVKEVVYNYKSDDEIDDEVNAAYTDLDRVLDKDKRKSVRESMSMKESRSSSSLLSSPSLKSMKSVTSSSLDSPRKVQYDPTEYFRGDPMKYGAYSRWKLAEQEISEKKNSKGKKKQGKVKKGKDNNPFNPENFYDSLKKLGSGPGNKDAATGLGVADAPSNKKPVTPKKGPTKKNKKKIITPDDIDKLFETKSAIKGTKNVDDNDEYDNEDTEEEEEEEEDEYDDDDDDDNEINKEEVNGNLSSSPSVASFNEMVSSGEEVPQWLADADKEAKKKRSLRGKKKKRLQDDWRFWLAIIASVGFVSAFWNIYQQSGGNFDNGPASFGFGMPTIGGGSNGGDELVL